jgi:galactofuranosylgalactofuranosylrhamnosyl-N-acetylglucosaminyl-diphospho-decaprenol beta-1,5/1,6-galactofuranosyltransferase
MDATVTEGMATPPVGKVAIGRAALRSLRHLVRSPQGDADRPQLQVSAQDAQWFVLSRLDRVTVGTADGRGVTFRHRDPAVMRDLITRCVQLNLRIRREFPRLQREYREAYPTLTSTESWAPVFRG